MFNNDRREIEVVGYAGELGRLTAYRVAPESIRRAQELLGLENQQVPA